VGAHRVLPVGYAPAWSPDGARIAFVTKGDLWTADADGTHPARIAKDADQPAWSPNGRRIAFTRDGSVHTIRADGSDDRRLAPGAHPAWSPNGERIALDRDDRIVTLRWYGGGVRVAGTGSDPAYASDGRLAVVREGQIVAGTRVVDEGAEPAWSADGKHVAYVRDGSIYIDRKRVRRGSTNARRPIFGSPAGPAAGCSASPRSSTTSGSARASSKAFGPRAQSGWSAHNTCASRTEGHARIATSRRSATRTRPRTTTGT
jgi:hypothetical protein